MKTLAVFEPAMAFFDPVLVQFAADLKWLEKYGVTVSRHNFGKEPEVFADNPLVAKEMKNRGKQAAYNHDRRSNHLDRQIPQPRTTGTAARH